MSNSVLGALHALSHLSCVSILRLSCPHPREDQLVHVHVTIAQSPQACHLSLLWSILCTAPPVVWSDCVPSCQLRNSLGMSLVVIIITPKITKTFLICSRTWLLLIEGPGRELYNLLACFLSCCSWWKQDCNLTFLSSFQTHPSFIPGLQILDNLVLSVY